MPEKKVGPCRGERAKSPTEALSTCEAGGKGGWPFILIKKKGGGSKSRKRRGKEQEFWRRGKTNLVGGRPVDSYSILEKFTTGVRVQWTWEEKGGDRIEPSLKKKTLKEKGAAYLGIDRGKKKKTWAERLPMVL